MMSTGTPKLPYCANMVADNHEGACMGWAKHRWAITALMLAALATGSAVGGMALASTGGPAPGIGVTSTVGAAAQQAARAFWTPARMAAATPVVNRNGVMAGPALSAPPGIPTARPFSGVPTVGALFFTSGPSAHYCTASVVNSTAQDLVLTAAHCVYFSGHSFSNIEFVPGYHAGRRPYGAWVAKKIFVASGWARGQNQNLDFAFVAVTPPPGRRPLQQVTGGLQLGINRPFRRPIEVIGYNSSDSRPVECATHSFEFNPSQLEFFCHGYRDGTSGSPWIVRFNGSNGTGLVIGTIGGFELGGNVEWASYSAYFGQSANQLFLQAEHQ
jgi:V8-like Glu-specific endopeptidase